MRLFVVLFAGCALALAAPACDSGTSTGDTNSGTGSGSGSSGDGGSSDNTGSSGDDGTSDNGGGGDDGSGTTDSGGGTTEPAVVDDGTCGTRECGLDLDGESCGLCDGGKACNDGVCQKDAACNPGETCCVYPWENEIDGKGLGEGCESDAECAFGKCLLPNEGGNITNAVFGFCTRACDCGSQESKLTDDEKAIATCLYSPGNQGSWRHAVLACANAADCQAVDSRWEDCGTPYGTAKVCMAGDP